MAEEQLELQSVFTAIADEARAILRLEEEDGGYIQVNCQVRRADPPRLVLFFPPHRLPKDLRLTRPCLLSIDKGDDEEPLLVTVIITSQTDPRTLEAAVQRQIDPATLRAFFRINLALPISLAPLNCLEGEEAWSLAGNTLDLSGSGALALFPADCPANDNIAIEIILDAAAGKKAKARCFGRVVFRRRLRGGRFQVALHFDDIDHKTQSAVIAACLNEQRRQLRENVRTDDSSIP
jgi:hypothetical protein